MNEKTLGADAAAVENAGSIESDAAPHAALTEAVWRKGRVMDERERALIENERAEQVSTPAQPVREQVSAGTNYTPDTAPHVAPTPGPWKKSGARYDCIVAGENGETHVVCVGHDYNDGGTIWGRFDPEHPDATESEAEANARLIAAAPELYEALEQIKRQCAGHADEFSGNVYLIADAAIRKAEGRGTP